MFATMKSWKWLTGGAYTWGFIARVIVKAVVLFAVINVVYALLDPIPFLGRLSLYNLLVPGRERLPYGESAASNNLSLNSIEAMFASHEISQPKPADEFRLIVIGDSSVWGILLENADTLVGQIDALNLTIDGRRVNAYNLGHPILSVTKDLMLLDQAMLYQPDAILWSVTLESLPYRDQLTPPLVANNAPRVRDLIARFDLPIDPTDPALIERTFWDRTLIGDRRALADWFRLQMLGFAWSASGIDQVIGDYTPRSNDFSTDPSWNAFPDETNIPADALAFDVIAAGHTLAGDVPVLLVNEPIYIADGENSDIRYNAWYPRWVYDQYRTLLTEEAAANGWEWIDLWDAIAPEEFTDSPVHLTPSGSRQLTERIAAALTERLTR